eukprot:jgi/Psemu1/305489/fgenesh1_kg.201_\
MKCGIAGSADPNTNTSNHISKKRSNGHKGLVMTRLLLESHHTTDVNKIKLVKDFTSRYKLGCCCLKIGRPGLVLIEGLKENGGACCASELVKNRTKQRATRETKKTGENTATFAIRGSVTSRSTMDSGVEPEKSSILPLEFEALDGSGMEKFKHKCETLGLLEWMPTLTQNE